ncbi:hypothetical protein [Paraburkholderia adhaesiva]|uniref:hypothetical protein n=1 Tax=Paraburkholderia adhaesiva TaxID=2883244 RepID=UPI001F170C0B|nr:hypothetical protein [Paraburkholderia adhaesiva]
MNIQEFIQTETPAIADAEDIATAARSIGLTKVHAWVEDESAVVSNTAERSKRCRARAEEKGLKQVSITAPVDHHAVLKAIAARTKDGEPLANVLESILAAIRPQLSPAPPKQEARPAKTTWLSITRSVMQGWRKWLSIHRTFHIGTAISPPRQ